MADILQDICFGSVEIIFHEEWAYTFRTLNFGDTEGGTGMNAGIEELTGMY
ncbi:hypothetical protein [Methylotuvimicrobium buryatense]|uniref:hypothetical protein n=1 Tax=Methylotuvimicrobium buryatense TaxID=95641 RepID=UPI00034BFE0D|nr:hypothetical protein [Methylotuvimicrobium buryatense]